MSRLDKLVKDKLDKLDKKKFSQTEFEQACNAGQLLIVIEDRVFDVEGFRHKHPGGISSLERYYARDATEVFFRVHGPNAHRSLEELYIGDLVPSIQISCNVNAKLDDVESKLAKQHDSHQHEFDPQSSKCPFATLTGTLKDPPHPGMFHQHPAHEHLDSGGKENEARCPFQHTLKTPDESLPENPPVDSSHSKDNRENEVASIVKASGFDFAYPEKDKAFDGHWHSDRNKHEPHFSTLEALVEEIDNENVSNGDNKTESDTPTSSNSDGVNEQSSRPSKPVGDDAPLDGFTRVKSGGTFSRSSSSGSFSKKIVENVLRRTGSGSSLRSWKENLKGDVHAELSEGGCPFKALTSLPTEFAAARGRRRSSVTKQDFSTRRGSGVFPGGNDFFSGPGKALESPRSIRSRDNASVASRQVSVYAQSKRSGHGTNLRSSGGVFRGARTRRKAMTHKKSSAPPINRAEWDFHAARLESSWKKLLKVVSYADLGGAIYESVRDNDILEPLFRFTNRSAQGTKFVDMLSSIVENLNSPANVYQKIADLAPLHHRKGVEISHMPMMQMIVLGVFRHALGDDFSQEEMQSWLWMWEYLTTALDVSLKVICSTMGVVRDSWETILESYTPGQLGEMIYDCLFKLAPNATHLFTKPREYMAIKMGDTLGMLVSFADDPDDMKKQVASLGLRHVKYNVRPHHIPLIAPVIVNVLAEACGEAWSEEIEQAWSTVIHMVCQNMVEAIQDGENFATNLEYSSQQFQEVGMKDKLKDALYEKLRNYSPEIFEVQAQSDPRKLYNEISMSQLQAENTKIASNHKSFMQEYASFKSGLTKKSSKKDVSNEKSNKEMSKLNKGTKAYDAFEGLIDLIVEFNLEILKLVWEPERQVEVVYIYAPKFYAMGIRNKHLKNIARSLQEAMVVVLDDRAVENFDDCLQWLWRLILDAFTKELAIIEEAKYELILDSYEQIRSQCEDEQLGKIFWKHLNDLSPEQTHLFRRSLKMWGRLLQHIMRMLVMSTQDAEKFFQVLFDLTVNHIRYGVKSEYLSPFGQALILTLEEILKPSWSTDIENMWKELWRRAANSMTRGLNMGGNGITHALVEGDVGMLEQAISCAPRNSRAQWLCEVMVNGASISPLYWALRDGKYALVEFILSDLLTIRADIHGYYYGREELFKFHEDIVGALGRQSVGLIPILLDGLLWHAKEKEDGRLVRVNYYIKDLYGDPGIIEDPWKSPLAWLIKLDDNESFKHPAVCKTLDLKWTKFALRVFLLKESCFLLMLVVFMIRHSVDPSGCDSALEWLRVLLLLLTLVSLGLQAWIIFFQTKKKIFLPLKLWIFRLQMPRCFSSIWNWIKIVACILIISSFANQTCLDGFEDNNSVKTAEAFAAILLWAEMFQISMLSTPMAAFAYTLGIMVRDLSHSLYMIIILIFGFGSALSIIGDPPFDEGWDTTAVILLQEVMGVAQPMYPQISSLTRFLLLVFVTCVTIGLLNVLIAQLTITYDRLNVDKEGFAMMHRASTCLEIETYLPLTWRRRLFNNMGFDRPLSFAEGDEGPCGGVQVLERDDCPRYVADRILRFTGDASPEDPWPSINFDEPPVAHNAEEQ